MPRYAEPIDLAARFDIRTIGLLCTDDDQVLSRSAVLDHANVKSALDDASGRIEAALIAGQRYSVEDLQMLTDNSVSHLKSIVCAIAMTRLLRRRPGTYTDLLQQVSNEAEEQLATLSKGLDVFSLDAQLSAGLAGDLGNRNNEHASLLNLRNNMSDNLIGRVFPHRGDTGRRRRDFGA
jgi:phage gp36-like protein